jgi:hypothetical protein
MAAGTGAIAQSAAGTQAARASADQTSQGQSTWPMDQLITASVHDAWLLSGRNEQKFFEMVTELAQISAQKRGLTLPDSEEAGKRFGEVVKSIAKTDHDQLLYVVVDKAVQQVAKKS